MSKNLQIKIGVKINGIDSYVGFVDDRNANRKFILDGGLDEFLLASAEDIYSTKNNELDAIFAEELKERMRTGKTIFLSYGEYVHACKSEGVIPLRSLKYTENNIRNRKLSDEELFMLAL